MSIKRARSVEHLINLVGEALDEFADLRFSAEYDTDEMESALGFTGSVESQLRDLLEELKSGTHEYKDEDLSFMAIVNQQHDLILPFKYLLRVINQTHRQGFEGESQD